MSAPVHRHAYLVWELTVIRHRGFRKEDITLPRHPSSNWVYCESNVDTFVPQYLSDLGYGILCFRNSHPVPDNLE
jgi:hypothetical protein